MQGENVLAKEKNVEPISKVLLCVMYDHICG